MNKFKFVELIYKQHFKIYMICISFSGKERDEETRYSYFGARYYEAELTTMWLSVDPMADKYPNMSPYNYCVWNPIKLVDPDGMAVDDWYNLKGELIKHTDSGTKKYLVLTEGTDVDESKTIPVPQQETLDKMSAVYKDNEKSANSSRVQNEKGMAVKFDGLPTQVVTGYPDYITKEQWNSATMEVGDMSNLDFLIHLHPLNLQDMKVGGPDPSDVDRDVHNFFNSKVNIIQYFNPTLDFNRSGLPTKIGDYVPSVSFYNQTSPKSIHTMSFRSFHSLVEKINAL